MNIVSFHGNEEKVLSMFLYTGLYFFGKVVLQYYYAPDWWHGNINFQKYFGTKVK